MSAGLWLRERLYYLSAMPIHLMQKQFHMSLHGLNEEPRRDSVPSHPQWYIRYTVYVWDRYNVSSLLTSHNEVSPHCCNERNLSAIPHPSAFHRGITCISSTKPFLHFGLALLKGPQNEKAKINWELGVNLLKATSIPT